MQHARRLFLLQPNSYFCCHHVRPIQLLRPPGLCSAVCPILTTPQGDLISILPGRVSERGSATGKLNMSSASTIGLGTATSVDVLEEDGPSETAPSVACSTGNNAFATGRYDSAYHSYHTCRSFVRRHIDTCNSELLGR